jgi:hypothetical protein
MKNVLIAITTATIIVFCMWLVNLLMWELAKYPEWIAYGIISIVCIAILSVVIWSINQDEEKKK